MGNATYCAILLLTLAGPLVAMATFRQARLSRAEWRRMLMVFACVSIPFVLLDAVQHARGWWAYNPEMILGPRLFGLPLEEVAFFFVVPFSSLCLYGFLRKVPALQAVTAVRVSRLAVFAMGVALLLALIEPKERTVFDAALCVAAAGAVGALLWRYRLHRYDAVWLCAIATLFFAVNGLLTALPVVTYNPIFGSVLRFGSIPLADGLYNVSLLVGSLLVFQYRRGQAARLSATS